MKKNFWTENRIVCVILYSILLSGGFIYYLLLENTALSVPCSYLELTGKMCPGCGLTRMMYSLLEFNFVKAFSYNPLMFTLLIVWNVIGVTNLIGKPKFMMNGKFLTVTGIISLASVFFFWFYRGLC